MSVLGDHWQLRWACLFASVGTLYVAEVPAALSLPQRLAVFASGVLMAAWGALAFASWVRMKTNG